MTAAIVLGQLGLPARTAGAQSETAGGTGPLAEPVLLQVVTNDPGIGIDQMLPDGTRRPVCAAPCRETVAVRDIYVVTEDGIPKSPLISLPEDEREVTLTVRRGSRGMRLTGEGLIGLGIAAQAVGFAFSGGDPSPDRLMAMSADRSRDHRGTFLAVGLAGLIVAGIGMLLLWRGLDHVDSSSGRSFHLSD